MFTILGKKIRLSQIIIMTALPTFAAGLAAKYIFRNEVIAGWLVAPAVLLFIGGLVFEDMLDYYLIKRALKWAWRNGSSFKIVVTGNHFDSLQQWLRHVKFVGEPMSVEVYFDKNSGISVKPSWEVTEVFETIEQLPVNKEPAVTSLNDLTEMVQRCEGRIEVRKVIEKGVGE